MEFFGMGPLEILVILIVGLIIFGPDKIPHLARNLGKGVAAIKKAANDLTSEVTKELEDIEGEKTSDRREAEEHEASKNER
jgi:TatA/E family protein of Tat protein translocase